MKLLLNKTKITIAILALIFCVNESGIAQCKSPVKEGIKKLNPYIHNGEVNTVTLVLGEPASVHITVYKGLLYKLQVGAESAVGKLNFRVIDDNNAEIYNSKYSKKPDSFEFFSNSAQELVVEISSDDSSKQGCAVVLVGIKTPKSGNSMRDL